MSLFGQLQVLKREEEAENQEVERETKIALAAVNWYAMSEKRKEQWLKQYDREGYL